MCSYLNSKPDTGDLEELSRCYSALVWASVLHFIICTRFLHFVQTMFICSVDSVTTSSRLLRGFIFSKE